MCDIDVLLNFGVFGTKSKDGDTFVPNRVCENNTDPYEQFCLIPPVARMTTTCNTFTNEKADAPDSLFQRVLDSRVRNLSQLPRVFESFPEDLSSANTWTPLTLTSEDLQFMSVITNTSPFAAINAKKLICLAPLTVGTTPDILQLYVLDSFGFLRPQIDTNRDLMQTNTTTDKTCRCFLTESGEAYALLNSLLFHQIENGTWEMIVTPKSVQDVLVSNSDVVIAVMLDGFFFVQSSTTITVTNTILWSCFTGDFQSIVFGVLTGALTMLIQIISIADEILTNVQWFATLGIPTEPFRWTACLQQTILPLRVLLGSGLTRPVLLVTLQGITATVQNTVMNGIPRIFGIYCVNGLGLIQNLRTNFVLTHPEQIGALSRVQELFVSSDNSTIWLFVGDILWRVQNETHWEQVSSHIYSDIGVIVNDELKQDEGITFLAWYNGQSQKKLSRNLQTPGAVLAQSRHNHYRSVITHHDTETYVFPFVVTSIERANEFLMFNTLAVKLYEDGNIVIETKTSGIKIWESNTHDQSSDASGFKFWTSPDLPLSTTNGLYILFSNAGTQTIRLVYNVFNNPRFALFCRESQEYAARALIAQADFCFGNLRIDDQKDGTAALFADQRCACVGGRRLLENSFPASSQFHSQTTGRLIANLPCLLSQCGASFLHGPEVTNVYDYVSATCKTDVTVCSDIIEIGANGKFDLTVFQMQQNCGTDPTACLRNEECPVGSVCVDGRCVLACTSDVQCRTQLQNLISVCDAATGRCLFPIKSSVVRANSIWRIVTFVCIGLTILLLVLFLAVFVKTKPSKKKTTK